MKKQTLLTVLLISFALTACSSHAVKGNSKPRKTVSDIMKGQYGKTTKKKESFRKGPQSFGVPYVAPNRADYTRTQAKELNGIFSRLPNPDICMYIDPHLSIEGATIPGYTSCFSMYEKNQYALPGEMTAIWQKRN